MNKLILILLLFVIGCSTTTIPTRRVLDCSELTTDPDVVSKKSRKWCTYQQIPLAPKSTPIQVPSELVK